MKGIQVSKGSASVKNGYESITGQINVDYLKPEDEQQVEVNLFGDTKSRIEANADANVHLSDKWATEILLHHENILKTMMTMAMVSMICQAENNIMYRTVGCIKASTTSFMVDLGL